MNTILDKLKNIETSKNIKILYACETGSRAWGFPSPDSDYDVRFIYMHQKDWYLSLAERKDTIEVSLDGDLDITGWDLKKSLVLLKKSNAPLIERFQSPMVYYADETFKVDFTKLIENYYSPTLCFLTLWTLWLLIFLLPATEWLLSFSCKFILSLVEGHTCTVDMLFICLKKYFIFTSFHFKNVNCCC